MKFASSPRIVCIDSYILRRAVFIPPKRISSPALGPARRVASNSPGLKVKGEKNPTLKGLAGTTARLNQRHDLGRANAKAVVRAGDTGTMNSVDVGAATATVGVRYRGVANPGSIDSPRAYGLRGINRVARPALVVDEGPAGSPNMQLLPSHVRACRRWNANRVIPQ